MKAETEWKGGELYEGHSQNGCSVLFDAEDSHARGPSPMEAVLMALCGCTGVDVVTVLQKKRQSFTSLKVAAEATQAASAPRVFTHIRLSYIVGGRVSRKAVEDAVALSKNKYCSVSQMLGKAMPIEAEIVYLDGEPDL